MSGKDRPKLWERIKKSFRELAQDLERESVSAKGSSPSACCHVPVEELERRRTAYDALAREKRTVRQSAAGESAD
jgi:hypothetical protein